MDLLPKQMCHRCSYKLEEFHKFYVDCLKTDAALKSQLSWMRKDGVREKIGVPMVHIENMKEIKAEPLDYDVYELEPLVENIDYINSMNSVTFPAGSIHNGLTYTTFSRCCCDKKDQSRSRRTTAELCQNYQGQMDRCDRIANVSQKRTFEDAARLKPIKRNVFTQSVFPDCPQNRLQRVENVVENAVENVRDRLVTDTSIKNNVATPETRNHCHAGLGTPPKNQAVARSTIMRNLRPRKNMNYAQDKSKISSVNPRPSTLTKSNVSEATSSPNFKLMRQIKVELIDEFEGRNLRPRKNVVDYQEPKMKKISDSRTKKRKLNEKSLKNDSTLNALDFKIKQEAPDDLENTMLSETTNTTPRLPSKFVTLPAKVQAMTSDNSISLRDDYLKSQFRGQFQLAERNSLSNIVRNRLAKTKKTYQFPRANCSPKYLRSQDVYLRNGKTKNNTEWSVKKLQTRKLINTINKKKSPMSKLSENIKHYCESCNVKFINKELFRLHACYYD